MVQPRKSVHFERLETFFLRERYRLVHLISFGGECRVYQALDIDTGNKIAIKVWPADVSDKVYRCESEKEYEVLNSLNHPNIIRVLRSGVINERFRYLVLEYISGASLKDWLFERGSLSLSDTTEVMKKVLKALVYLEKNNVIHNDLKPANIVVYNNNNLLDVKLVDFGNAVVKCHQQYDELKKCSPVYCAPEVLRGEVPTIKSDIYSWGLIFIECLIGRAAVCGKNLSVVMNKQVENIPVCMPEGISQTGFAFLLSKAVQKEKEKRWQDSISLYNEFNQLNEAFGELAIG